MHVCTMNMGIMVNINIYEPSRSGLLGIFILDCFVYFYNDGLFNKKQIKRRKTLQRTSLFVNLWKICYLMGF